MGTLVEKDVRMGPPDWNKTASEAITLAVTILHDEANLYGMTGRVNALISAGNLLSAARRMRGHANMLDLEGGDDVAKVDVWDLSDEEEENPERPAWPQVSAKLREIAGDDSKLLPMVEQIDRLHELAVEKGLPQVTVGQIEEALAAA